MTAHVDAHGRRFLDVDNVARLKAEVGGRVLLHIDVGRG